MCWSLYCISEMNNIKAIRNKAEKLWILCYNAPAQTVKYYSIIWRSNYINKNIYGTFKELTYVFKKMDTQSSRHRSVEKNLTSIHLDTGSIPGLIQLVKDMPLP